LNKLKTCSVCKEQSKEITKAFSNLETTVIDKFDILINNVKNFAVNIKEKKEMRV
jgi:hypothetical protein